MTYVITKACIGTKDRSCVEVCPVDCFYDHPDKKLNETFGVTAAGSGGDNPGNDDENKDWGMLVINPDECIHCGACETECPVNAIYEDTGVPEDLQEFVKINENATMNASPEEMDSRRVRSKK